VRGQEGEALRVATPAGDLLALAGAPAPVAGTRVLVAVRPERITLLAAPPDAMPEGAALLRGEVASAVYVGARTELRVTLPGDEVMLAEAPEPPGHGLSIPGATVFMLIRAADCLALPPG